MPSPAVFARSAMVGLVATALDFGILSLLVSGFGVSARLASLPALAVGIVGGFAALRIVHDWTLASPEIAPQQFDVLTMIGFVILIGTVVNNAILLVEQARNFMGHVKIEGLDIEGMDPTRAIAESVRTRVRPIFMTTLTTVMGGLPLVVAPGAGSEMYRGLGAVILGGGVRVEAAGVTVGAVGVSGAPGGDADDACAKAGIAAVQDKLDF